MSKTFKTPANDNDLIVFDALTGAGADWGDWETKRDETIARRDARKAAFDYDQKFLKIDGREG